AARAVTRKVVDASKADGAHESGLTPLIWNQVLSYGTDAMITVALAGTVFFGASANAQRGNVLLYLLITMAPFAVVAPIIGPALDRLQHGRRWTMAGTAVGRGILALIMAAHPTELLVLYPCALGSLVLSKAYGVVRAAAAPRLVPRGLTLTEANARLTIFGLGSTIVLGGVVGVLIKITGSYTFGLVVTAIGFFACAFFAFKLPKQVDSAAAAPRHPQEPVRPRTQERVPPMSRLQSWAKRGFDPHLVIALQGESVLRLLSGLLTIYLAFYVESTQHGLKAALELALVIGAAGVGNFLGTAIGTRLKMGRPELLITLSTCVAGVVCLVVALTFSPMFAAVAMLISAVANALSKIALDALIQRDVVETLRSSAFARSETFLQLAWVIGAAVGVALPSSDSGDGGVAFLVAGVVTATAGLVIFLRSRTMARATAIRQWPERPGPPGSVVQRSLD
ncbi:MAG TPA: MFS transporter, partial [Jatrophihabitans sp.]|nr:MFS transporter [Jatrophihabitans sp.]